MAVLRVALLLAIPSSVAAADDPAPAPSNGFLDNWNLETLLRAEGAYGVAAAARNKLDLTVEPKITGKLPGDVEFVTIGRFRDDVLDELVSGRPRVFELRESYIKFELDDVLFTLGKQQVVWGNTDGFRVLDVVDPFSFREAIIEDFEDSRIPLWTANVQIPIGQANLQLLWIPDSTTNYFPPAGSTFALTSPRYIPQAVPGVNAVVLDTQQPSRSDENFGVRLSGNVGGWDLTANFLHHYDTNPLFFRSLSFQGYVPTVSVFQGFRQTNLVGGTFSNAFGSLVVRGEADIDLDRYFLSNRVTVDQGLVKAKVASSVLGLDWTKITDTFISAQVFQTDLLGDTPGLIQHKDDTIVSLLVRRSFSNQTWTAEAFWLHDLRDNDGLLRLRVRYNARDNVNLWTGADYFYGTSVGTFGQFDKSTRILIGSEWRF